MGWVDDLKKKAKKKADEAAAAIKQIGSGDVQGGLENIANQSKDPTLALVNSIYNKEIKKGKGPEAASKAAGAADDADSAKKKEEMEARRLGYLSLVRTSPSGLTPQRSGSRARLTGY